MTLRYFLAEQFRLFCNTTGIRGFSFALNSKSRFELAVWSSALIIGLYMTVSDSSQTIQFYINRPTTTKLTLRSEKTLNLSHLIVCLFYKNSRNVDTTSKYNLSSLIDQKNVTNYFRSYIKRLSSPTGNTSILTEEEYQLILAVDSVVHKLFLEDSPYGNVNENYGSIDESGWLNNNTNLTELVETTGRLIWCMSKLSATQFEGDIEGITQYCVNHFQLSWLGPEILSSRKNLCFSMNQHWLSFKTPSSELVIKFELSLLRRDLAGMSIAFDSDSCNHREIENNLLVPRADIESYNSIMFRIDGVYKSLGTVEKPCSNVTIFNCLMNCYQKSIWEEYKCLPLLSIFRQSSSVSVESSNRFCAFNQSHCNQGNISCATKRQLLMAECRKKCKFPCHKTVFGYYLQIFHEYAEAEHAIVSLCVDTYFFPIFEEILLVGPKQFLAQLGGNLSLWIGASFLVLLHVLVSLFRMPFLYFNYSADSRVTIEKEPCSCCKMHTKAGDTFN